MKNDKIGDDRLTNIWIGVGIFNALIFIFLAGDFMEAIKGFLTIFGD
jgi:hypothetical protein